MGIQSEIHPRFIGEFGQNMHGIMVDQTAIGLDMGIGAGPAGPRAGANTGINCCILLVISAPSGLLIPHQAHPKSSSKCAMTLAVAPTLARPRLAR